MRLALERGIGCESLNAGIGRPGEQTAEVGSITNNLIRN